VRTLAVATLNFPLLRSAEEFERGTPPPAIADAQQAIAWAEHLVIIFPLWLGSMPALFKGFFEQVLRPRFAFGEARKGRLPKKLLSGRTARIIVTMGMPGFFYRLYYRAHTVRTLERNVLEFCGIRTVGSNIIGMMCAMNAKQREKWLARVAALGGRAG
jgi:putative NADPH-quinone reductase